MHCPNQVDYKVDTRAVVELISRSAASNVEQHRLLTQRMIQEAVEHRLPFDIHLDVKLPDVMIPETVVAAAAAASSALVYQMGHIGARCQVQAADAQPGSYDRCQVTWSGWSIIACSADTKWQTLPDTAPERALVVGDISWVCDVSVARTDMEHTQLVVTCELPSVAVRASSRTIEHATVVSLAVYGDVADNAAAVELDDKEVSTMVGFAGGGVRMLESGWDTLRRREMGVFKGAVDKYAQWVRADMTVRVGQVCATLFESKGAAGAEKELVRLVVRGLEASGEVRSLDATARASVAAVELEDHVQPFGDAHQYIVCSRVEGCGRVEEPVLMGSVHVWNGKSPHRAGLDVALEATLGQLAVGANLDTLAVVQNCVAEAIEAGILRADALAASHARGVGNGGDGAGDERSRAYGSGAGARGPAPVAALPSNPMTMAASMMHAAGSSVAGRAASPSPSYHTHIGSRLALKFVGTLHAVDMALLTSRRSAPFPVARLRYCNRALSHLCKSPLSPPNGS